MTPRRFTVGQLTGRMRRAAKEARAEGFAGLIVTGGRDLAYFCGYAPPEQAEDLTALLLEPGRPPTMVVPRPEISEAMHSSCSTVRFVAYGERTDPYRVFGGMLRADSRYGISDDVPGRHLLGLQQMRRSASFVALTRALPMLRAIKDDEELRRMSAAAAAADAACRELLGVRFAGRSERELADELSHIMRRNGYDRAEPTVVSARRGQVLRDGDTVIIGFGGLKDGYASRLTRTVYVGQTPPEEVRTAHGLVRSAFEAALRAIRPGTECQEIDRVMRHVLIQGGYRDHMPPLAGHGIGMATKEPPILADGETRTLRAGMCLTLSPGIFLPGRFGIRLEDIVVVTHDGAARLTRTTPLLTPIV